MGGDSSSCFKHSKIFVLEKKSGESEQVHILLKNSELGTSAKISAGSIKNARYAKANKFFL